MKLSGHKRRKYYFIIIALSVWMWWDLSQARSGLALAYKSWFLNSETKAAESSPATVAIVRSDDAALADPCSTTDEGITYQTISQMVRRAVDLAGGLNGIIKSGDTVLIKPNLVQADSSGSGGVTDVRVVKALVYLVDEIDHGNIRIIVGDGSPRPCTQYERDSCGTTQRPWAKLFDKSGYQQLKAEMDTTGIDFHLSNLNGNSETNPLPELDTVIIPGGGYAQPQNGRYFIHKDVIHATVYISVPVMKIHNQPGFTAALKNQIGLAPSTKYGFNKTTGVTKDGRAVKLLHQAELPYNWQDKEIVDLSVIAKIKFNVVDALSCLETQKSPIYTSDSINTHITNRIKMNTIIAGYDPVAVDNVCCRIMGLNPDDIEHITLAERAGLGTNDPDKITVVGTSISQTKKVFKKGQLASSIYGQSNRTWLLNGTYSITGITDPMSYEFIANEAFAAPNAGTNGWSEPIYFDNDQIMLKDYYGLGSESVVSYAFSYIKTPAAQLAELWVGSDEALKIYLNGTVVYNYSGTRTFSGTAFYIDTVSINLTQGWNRLLVKSYQSIGNYNFSLNICDVESNVLYRGNRVLGLKFSTDTGTVAGINNTGELVISNFELQNCYPNPFNPATNINYTVPAGTKHAVSLRIYDLSGREVANLINEEKPAGTYTIQWNASHLSSGVYFAKLRAGKFTQVRKMMLIK